MLQKRQFISGSGPWARYRRRASKEENLDLRVLSEGVSGRRAESRTNKMSVGICRRDSVRVNMFSGWNGGKLENSDSTAEMKRMFNARLIFGGVVRMGTLWLEWEERIEL